MDFSNAAARSMDMAVTVHTAFWFQASGISREIRAMIKDAL